MTRVASVALTLLPLAAVGLLWARARKHATATFAGKAVASALFLVVAFAEVPVDARYAALVRAALVLCAAGDLCLVGESRRHLAAGIALFGLGHVAFCAAFAPLARLDVALALGAALAAGAAVVLWRVRERLGPLAAPAALYALAVSATAALGVGAWVTEPAAHGRALLGAGALLFFASDLAVARQRFATDAIVNRLVGVPLYYGAQALLALSLG